MAVLNQDVWWIQDQRSCKFFQTYIYVGWTNQANVKEYISQDICSMHII